MYYYTDSGLSNIYLANGFNVEVIDEEEYTSINNINGLHKTIALTIVDSNSPLTNEEFKFLRVELNISQKALATSFGVNEQTIARYEKNEAQFPRTTDASLIALFMENLDEHNPVRNFLELLADAEPVVEDIRLEEVGDHWKVIA